MDQPPSSRSITVRPEGSAGWVTQAVIDVTSGAAQMMIVSPLSALPLARAGKLRLLAVTSANRAQALPEVPTVQEGGLKGFEFSSAYGLLAPRDTLEFLNAYYDRVVSVILEEGGRVDKFSSIDNAVFSPRTALILKPAQGHTFRLSYNRAFRAPSMINNNLDVTISNPLPLFAVVAVNVALMAAEGLTLEFTEDAIDAIADVALARDDRAGAGKSNRPDIGSRADIPGSVRVSKNRGVWRHPQDSFKVVYGQVH